MNAFSSEQMHPFRKTTIGWGFLFFFLFTISSFASHSELDQNRVSFSIMFLDAGTGNSTHCDEQLRIECGSYCFDTVFSPKCVAVCKIPLEYVDSTFICTFSDESGTPIDKERITVDQNDLSDTILVTLIKIKICDKNEGARIAVDVEILLGDIVLDTLYSSEEGMLSLQVQFRSEDWEKELRCHLVDQSYAPEEAHEKFEKIWRSTWTVKFEFAEVDNVPIQESRKTESQAGKKDSISVNIRVVDEDDTTIALSGTQIKFRLENIPVPYETTAVTNENGQIELEIEIPHVDIGQLKLYYCTTRDDYSPNCNRREAEFIEGCSLKSKCTIKLRKFKPPNALTVIVRNVDSTDQCLPNISIEFTFSDCENNRVFVDTCSSDSNGRIVLEIPLDCYTGDLLWSSLDPRFESIIAVPHYLNNIMSDSRKEFQIYLKEICHTAGQ